MSEAGVTYGDPEAVPALSATHWSEFGTLVERVADTHEVICCRVNASNGAPAWIVDTRARSPVHRSARHSGPTALSALRACLAALAVPYGDAAACRAALGADRFPNG